MRKITSLMLTLTIIFCLTTSVYCTDEIQPLWDNTHSVDASINFSGTEGTFTAYIAGYNNVTDIHLMAWLYYKDSNGDWIEQTTWGALSTNCTLGMDRTFTGVRGVEYKVDYTVYVYVGTAYDEISFTTYETCPLS